MITPERMRQVADRYDRLARQFDDAEDNEVVELLRAGAAALDDAKAHEAFRCELSARLGCSSPDGSAELGQVEMLLADLAVLRRG